MTLMANLMIVEIFVIIDNFLFIVFKYYYKVTDGLDKLFAKVSSFFQL